MSRFLCLVLFFVYLAPLPNADAQAKSPHTANVTIAVTVLDHRPSAASESRLSEKEVIVRQAGKIRPVLAWRPLAGASAGIDLAVLIDDSLQPTIALQWRDVGGLIRLLPQGSRIAVAYGANSAATVVQPFTTDRDLAVKSLRMPKGRIDEGASIYLSLVDLVRHWPADGRQRVVLLISDGVDLFYGVVESEPGLNGNLQQAIDASQKNGVVVDAIAARGASHFSRNRFLAGNGQDCLSRLALETGGMAYGSGLEEFVSLSPFLKQIDEAFANMYLLTFRASLPAKPGFSPIQLGAESRGMELLGPSRVYLPAGP